MRTQSATNRPVQQPVTASTSASAPTSKALPSSRKNEPAPRSTADTFEPSGSKARPALTLVPGEAPAIRAQPSKNAPIDPKDIPAADWTCFVNLNADNNLERFGKDDLNEMEKVGSIEGKLNVIALVDGGSQNKDGWNTGTRLMYVSRDPNDSSKIASREIAVDPSSDLGKLLAAGKGELDTGSPEVLRAAVDYVQKNIPSEHFMLDLWDHGNSWHGVSYDDRPQSNLDMPELQQALSGLSKKVDILSADACLMASVEVADTAKAVGADWLVGSEEVEPGTGWNYTDLLTRMSKLFEGEGSVSADSMAKTIMDSYATGPSDNVTMSATRLSELDGLNSKLDGFSDALIRAGGLKDRTIRSAYEQALRFEDAEQMDLGDFARRVAQGTTDPDLKAAAEQLQATIAQATLKTGAKGAAGRYDAATGLTIYGPKGSVDSQYQQNGSAWLNSRWNDVIKTYRGAYA